MQPHRNLVVAFCTGKSFSEVLILASANPQYDKRLSIDLPVQYLTIPNLEHGKNMGRTWGEHVAYISCSECQNKKQFLYITCSPHVLPHVLSLEFSCTELVIQWTIFCHIVG